MHILVFSRAEAESPKHYCLKIPHAWISICDSKGGKHPVLPDNEHRVAVLQLIFDDLEEPLKNFVSFDSSHAAKILDFVEGTKGLAECYGINCYAGISRRAGVATALCGYFDKSPMGYYAFGQTYPNELVRRELLQEMGRRRSLSVSG